MFTLNYTPYTLPLAITATVSLWLAFIVWRRRPSPGVYAFVLLMGMTTWWAIAYALELAAPDLNAKSIFAGLQFPPLTTVPVFWLMFVLEYTGQERWLTRRNLLLLGIIPLITSVAGLTNLNHTMIYSARELIFQDTFYVLNTTKSWLFWINAGYAYILLLGSSMLLLRGFLSTPQLYQGQVVALLVGTLAPWVANITYLTDLSPFPSLDLTPFAFTVSGAAFAWSMIRYRMLDLLPVARDKIVTSMMDAVMVLDAQNRIVEINPAGLAIIGAPLETVIGKTAREALVRYTSLMDRFGNLHDGREEVSLTTPDQRERHYQMLITPLRRRDGNITGRTVILHEITELKMINRDLVRAQAQALEVSKLKSEFLATMSHELRTPLNAIIGYSDLLLAGVAGALGPMQTDYVRRTLNNGERLLALINDILDISKIEAGRLELINDPFASAQLLDNAKARLQSLADRKGLKLSTTFDPTLPAQLVGDLKRLEQILSNLIGNAIRFTDQGSVEVRFERRGESTWVITVSDTGIGIAPHALEYIFDEFRQGDGTTQREHGGTGLGLAIVRKLVVLMNGSISVQSEVNKGSTFTVQLPLRTPDPMPASSKDQVMEGPHR